MRLDFDVSIGQYAQTTRLVEGSDGALYGTAASGGSDSLGTVFTLHRDGSGYALLYSFTGTNGDGQDPYGGR